MKKVLLAAVFSIAAGSAQAGAPAMQALTVYHDPSCGCCVGWIDHMRESGFDVKAIQTRDMGAVKDDLGIPKGLDSCHTAVIDATGQKIEGHVPANAVNKMLARPDIKGVAAPGMPHNSPGMGPMDGNLVTVDFDGKPFSRD